MTKLEILIVIVFGVVAVGAIGNFDYADQLTIEAVAKDTRPHIASVTPLFQERPKFPDCPRCPKQNASGDWLKNEFSTRSESMGCVLECRYEEARL